METEDKKINQNSLGALKRDFSVTQRFSIQDLKKQKEEQPDFLKEISSLEKDFAEQELQTESNSNRQTTRIFRASPTSSSRGNTARFVRNNFSSEPTIGISGQNSNNDITFHNSGKNSSEPIIGITTPNSNLRNTGRFVNPNSPNAERSLSNTGRFVNPNSPNAGRGLQNTGRFVNPNSPNAGRGLQNTGRFVNPNSPPTIGLNSSIKSNAEPIIGLNSPIKSNSQPIIGLNSPVNANVKSEQSFGFQNTNIGSEQSFGFQGKNIADSSQSFGFQGKTPQEPNFGFQGKASPELTKGEKPSNATDGLTSSAGPMPPPGAMPNQPMTGVLRQDLEIIPPGKHGTFAMLFDKNADAYYRIDARMAHVISFLNVSEPIDTFLEKMKSYGTPVTKEELIQILSFLQQNNLTIPEYGRMQMKYKQQKEMMEKTTFLRICSSYMFFRLPPWRPEFFFESIRPYVSWLASKQLIYLLLIPSLIGYLLMIRNFGEVKATFLDSLSWAALAKYLVAIMIIKVLHESAHSLAAIHFKCRVRGIGIGFMVFAPRMYTDTTDSWRLPRYQRLLIDAAGIIIEILIGGIAALIWCYASPGVLRSTMFYIFAVSTISTIFVNGNPCIRYDGYYILCDLMHIENLMSRSSEYFKEFTRWYFYRLGQKPNSEHSFFLLVFGVCSFIYRFFLYTGIILVIYHTFTKAVAVVMLILELYSTMIYPFVREVKTVRLLAKQSKTHAHWFMSAFGLSVLALVLLTPYSWNIGLSAEIVPVASQLVSVLEDGYLKQPLKHEARDVKKGDLLFSLKSPSLEIALKRLDTTWEYDKRLYHLQQVDQTSFSETLVTEKKIQSDKISYDELKRREQNLQVHANMDGKFISRLKDLSTNAYLPKGQVIGEVVSKELIIYAYAQDKELYNLKKGQTATIYTKDSLETSEAEIVYVNQISSRLRNSPLLQHLGGPIPVYIEEGRAESYSSVLSLYRVELRFIGKTNLTCGRTVKVDVHHKEQLIYRLWKFIVSAFRKEF